MNDESIEDLMNRVERDRPEQDISLWFELSYAQYLTIPRSILESMPREWNLKFAALLFELDESIAWRPTTRGRYWCRLKDKDGRFVHDPLMNYRHPDRTLIDELKKK